ncbi:hypothetical protein D3C83_207070 [compost metagenome]
MRRHLQVLGRLVETQHTDRREELLRDLRDGDVGDLDFLLANQVQQQIERTGELIQLDQERRVGGFGHG